jgi:ABC-2 type transport system permease protein
MPVKLGVIVGTWTVLLLGLYVGMHRGLKFLYETAGVGPFLLERLWYLFLFVIALLLAVSQLASAYSTIIRAPETRWWSTFPLSSRAIARAKWAESSSYSGWAAMLLTVPLGIAYLSVIGRPAWLFAWLTLLLLPFMAIMTALSSVALLAWLRWGIRMAVRREVVALGFVAACAALFWALGEQRRDSAPKADVWFVALQELLPRMQIAMSPWMPSSWVARALSAGVERRWIEGWTYAALLWTTAAVAFRVFDHVAAALLPPVLRAQTWGGAEAAPSRRAAPLSVDRWWSRTPLRASLVKDWLLVARDPMQWTQAVVFFGLLGAYFANIHRLSHISSEPGWRVGVAALNLSCTLLVFGSLAVRFVFPQMSLEGRRLWLLRVSPEGIRHLMRAKLYLYGLAGVAIIETLLWMSASRLGVPMAVRWWLAGVGVLAALSIVGLTVGLGACWIDPDAQDAARVVSSSSGALVLVLMLAYVGSVAGALVLAWTSWAAGSAAGALVATVGLMGLSGLAGWIPVQAGLRTLERFERAEDAG